MAQDKPKADLNQPFAGHFRPGTRLIQNWPGDKVYDGKPFGQGQCVACGFLSRRSIDPAHPAAEEVPVDDRQTGQFFFLTNGSPGVPWCLVHAADLLGETQAHDDFIVANIGDAASHPRTDIYSSRERHSDDSITVREASAIAVVMRDRKCPEWFPYREFQSPAEHRDERNLIRIEEERRAHAAKLTEMELKVHEGSQKVQEDSLAIARELKAVQEGLAATTAKTDRFTTRWTRVAVSLAVASLIVVAVSYFLPHLGSDIAARILGASPVPLP